MPGNVAPIYAKVAKIGFAHLAAAVTAADLTNAGLIFTADATNGSIVNEVRIKYRAGTSTVATVFRLWINNNSKYLYTYTSGLGVSVAIFLAGFSC